MPDVLDQNEIDALLSAVEEGELPDPVKDEEEASAGIAIYDFKRPERVSKDQLRTLGAMHEGFARNLAAALSGFMRTIVEVRLASVEQITYSEFILSLPNPTHFAILNAEPLEGRLMLEINPSIVFPIIDRLLGGGKEQVTIPERPLTDIEQRLAKRLLDLTLTELHETWIPIEDINFNVAQVESNPQLVQIVAPNESVVLIGLELSLGDMSGMMNLCVPFRAIESVINRFSLHMQFSFKGRSSTGFDQEKLRRRLSPAVVQVIAYLAQTSLRMNEVLALQPGDIIQTEKRAKSDILITIEGRPKFRASPGRHKRSKAFIVTNKARRDGKI